MVIGKERSKEEKMVVRQQRQRICSQGYNVELAPQSLLMQRSEREREREREKRCVCDS
ncbi:unnamed protein product [Musa hybrid cultivar]